MKLYVFAAFALAAANAQSITETEEFEDCVECLEDVDDARDCLRECNNIDYRVNGVVVNTLLAECLDVSGDFGSIDSLDELVDCCSLDNDCEDDIEDVQDCLEGCIDGCIADDAEDYLECIREETGDKDCTLSECLDSFFADDIEEELSASFEISGSKSADIFDLRSIAGRLESIEEDDLEDCELLADFVDGVCDIGEDCCDECQPELGVLVDCIINEVVIPFVAIELNETILSCPIDTEECELDSRSRSQRSRKAKEVTAEEAPLFNKALSLPKKEKKDRKNRQSKRDPRKEAFVQSMGNRKLEQGDTSEIVAACEAKMRMDIISSNITHATNVYMECVTSAALSSMVDAETDSAAPGVAKFAGLVLAIGASLLF